MFNKNKITLETRENKMEKIKKKGLRKTLFTTVMSMGVLLGCTGMLVGCGEAGPKGDTGATGPAGPQGVAGSSFLTDEGVPASTYGANGDVYLDSSTFNLYKKVDGVWTELGNIKGDTGDTGDTGPEGSQGAAGVDGSMWFTGTALTGTGTEIEATVENTKVGDLYFNTTTCDLYQCVAENTWNWISNIKGEQGATGPAGEQGSTGQAGEQGVAGVSGATWLTGTAISGTTSGISAEITDSKIGDLYYNTTSCDLYQCVAENTWDWLSNLKGEQGVQGVQGATGKDGVDVGALDNMGFMHISFDDVTICFNNLKNNSYTSLYDEPFFNWLKTLHDTYGAKFSLYAYNSSLTSVPNTYAEEFFEAKDWLKIGLHATDSSSNFGSSTYEQGKTAWNTFVDNVTRITGTYLSVDRMPRLHTFAGSEEALKGMRDANYGAIGFLSADDARNSYYFDDETTTYLYSNDHITDYKNGLTFVATDLRTDWFAGTSASNEYREPTKDNVYDELVERYTNVEFANSVSSYILFGHEWQFYNGTTLTETGKKYFEDACKFANEYNINFDYSQNKAFNPTPYDIYPQTTTAGGNTDSEEEQEPAVTTVKYFNTDMQIVDSISEMTFDINYTLPGGATTDFKDATVDGRATCVTEVLAVNGGETIDFVSNLAEVFGSTDLSWALMEFSSAPLSVSTLSYQNVTASTTDLQQKAACGFAWLTGDTSSHTLNSNTRYIMLSFKNGDGSVDFTPEQLEKLSQCLTIS
ncbi:MAG: collagen-like protein [Clostridia bacterium]|nr:collagen-like protein [Clostridia bacterium]